MKRPVRDGYLKIGDAINYVMRHHFADRHAAVWDKFDAESDARKRNFVPSGDPALDKDVENAWEPSRQVQLDMAELYSDAQYLLRQWLCDGKVQAFYRDANLGSYEVKIDPAAWEVESTDEAINGGKFYPTGRQEGQQDQNSGGPIRILRSELEAVSPKGALKSKLENRPRVGAPQTVLPRVIDAMRNAPRHHWDGVSLASMAATFGAAPGTVQKARELIRQQLANGDAEN